MPRVLLLAATTGYQTRAFGEAARTVGIDLVFATDRCHVLDDPWRDGAIPIHFHEQASAVDAIAASARTAAIHGIVAVGDRPTIIAAHAAKALGLAWHPPEAAAISRNKRAMRERFRASQLLTPAFVVASDARELAAQSIVTGFPAVLKPLALSGSRGVMRVDDLTGLDRAAARLAALLTAADVRAERYEGHGSMMLESFIPGREYAIEGLMTNGQLTPLAIFDKPDPLDGPFFEETIYVTPSSADAATQADIVAATSDAARAIGLWHGPIHAECRNNETGVYVLEVAARPIGGLCARALRFVTPSGPEAGMQSLEGLLLAHAVGASVGEWVREPLASGVMMIPIPARGMLRGVHGVEAALAVPGIVDLTITAKQDQVLVPLPEGSSYLGFIFARGATSAEVEASLRRAHAALTFDIAPELRVLQSIDG